GVTLSCLMGATRVYRRRGQRPRAGLACRRAAGKVFPLAPRPRPWAPRAGPPGPAGHHPLSTQHRKARPNVHVPLPPSGVLVPLDSPLGCPVYTPADPSSGSLCPPLQ
uniref:Uncharacterized protein n=1 Tax=Lynx canadensis TaxID=61383 RepID=A0A667HR99_LYNCA